MRETKDQTIARLEKVINEQKKELTEVKKDRKRLKYAVERLGKQVKNLSNQSSKEDVVKIKELENTLEKGREYYRELAKKYNHRGEILKKVTHNYITIRDSYEHSERNFNMKRLSSFMAGLYEDIDSYPLFDIDTLLTRVNILNGEWISTEISHKIKERLTNNNCYEEAIKRCEPYMEAAKRYDTEAMDFICLEVWKLLREYSDIFIDDWIEATNNIPNTSASGEIAKEHRF